MRITTFVSRQNWTWNFPWGQKKKKIDLNWFLPRNYILFYISSFVRKKEWKKKKKTIEKCKPQSLHLHLAQCPAQRSHPEITSLFKWALRAIFWIKYSWPFLINWSPWLLQFFVHLIKIRVSLKFWADTNLPLKITMWLPQFIVQLFLD